MIRSISLVVFLMETVVVSASDSTDNTKFFSTYKPAGMQSGPDEYGSTFVSSAAYSAIDNSVILTGTTWGRFFESREQIADEDYDQYGRKIDNPRIVSGCFLANAALPGSSPEQLKYYLDNDDDDLFWAHKQRIRAPSANEACSAVHLFQQSQSVIIAGHTEELTNSTINQDVIAEETKQFGMMLDLDWMVAGDKSFKTVGGQMLKDTTLIYPTAITAASENENDGIFVIFMEASNDAKHVNIKEGQQPHDPVSYYDYGVGFGMGIARYDFVDQKITPTRTTKMISQTWMEPYVTTEAKGQVLVSDILHLQNDILLVSGTTNGQGPAFGADSDQGADMDGFLTKFSSVTGELIPSGSKRLQSSKDRNDWVNAMCSHPKDPQNVYVVGTTEGQMPHSQDSVDGTSAFLMKVDVNTLEPLWTKHFSASAAAIRHKPVTRGMACAFTPDGSTIWFGGVVEDNGVVHNSGLAHSYGGMDIFIAQLTIDGEVNLVKQVGSNKDDELALRGGLVVDTAGNAVLVGNTYGSFYRERDATETGSDVFVFTLSDFDGEVLFPVSGNGSTQSQKNTGFILSSVAFVAVVIAAALYVKRRGKPDATTSRSKVTQYLGSFDVEDVELRHSATGGWHCNFTNRLADGVFVPRSSGRPSLKSHKSGELPDTLMRIDGETARDLMFSDAHPDEEDTMDSSGRALLQHDDVGEDERSAYHDLVAAYNSTWEEQHQQDALVTTDSPPPSWGRDIV